MNVLEKARDLGKAISDSAEYQDFLDRERTFLGTEDAVGLMKEFEKETLKLQNIQALDLEIPPSALHDLRGLEEKIRNHPVIQRFFESQKNYEELLHKINEEINGAIDRDPTQRTAGGIQLEGV